MAAEPYRVLFLCTGNSARSIFAEALLNHLGEGRFQAFSAGSDPRGEIHPTTLRVLETMRVPAQGLRSKSWEELAGDGAPAMDFVFTVCDRAAAEPCPIWPGQPVTAHWGIEDPARAAGDPERELKAFRAAFFALQHRIRLFLNLPLKSLDRMRLQREVDEIGRSRPEASA